MNAQVIDPTAWEAAAARYDTARKAEAHFYDQKMKPANERWAAFLAEWPYIRATMTDAEALARYDAASADVDSHDQQYTELIGVLMEAEREIAVTPAPNVAALAFKVEVMRLAAEECVFPEEHLGIIAADANRLAAVQ